MPFEISMYLEIPVDVDASLTPVEVVRYSMDMGFSPKSRVCVIPASDTPQYYGAHSTDPQGGWIHVMDGTANFHARVVREEPTVVQTFTDGCYDKAVTMGVDNQLQFCLPWTGALTGWTPGLDNTNTTDMVDYVGYTTDCVNEYRTLGVAPCMGQIWQPMEMQCDALNDLWAKYHGRFLYVRITSTTVGSKKGGLAWQDFTWP